MKMFKYMIAAMLVVAVSRKMYMKTPDHLSTTDIQASNNDDMKIIPSNMEGLFYVPQTRNAADLATGTRYVGVQEFNPTVTPPTTTQSAIKLIRIISKDVKNGSNHDMVMTNHPGYGSSSKIALFGFPVTGKARNVSLNNNFIGFYWPHEQIVSLENGTMFVGVKKTKTDQKTESVNYSKTERKALEKEYNIDPNDIVNVVHKIGTLSSGDVLYGFLYPMFLAYNHSAMPTQAKRKDNPKAIINFTALEREIA